MKRYPDNTNPHLMYGDLPDVCTNTPPVDWEDVFGLREPVDCGNDPDEGFSDPDDPFGDDWTWEEEDDEDSDTTE